MTVDPVFPYQAVGAQWLSERRFALLGDEMRVGKTPQAIQACDWIGAENVLVVCPAVARMDWVRKFKQFGNREMTPVFSRGAPPKSRGVVTSYGLVDADLYRRPWDALILDESHYLKSVEAGRAVEILGRNGLIRLTKHAWFLSGTPAPNNYAELWTILRVCGVYRGSHEQFVAQYCTTRQTPYGQVITGNKNAEQLQRLLDGFMLRRTLKEVRPDIPDIQFSDYVVALDEGMGLKLPPVEAAQQAELLQALENAADPMLVLEAMAPAVSSLRRYVGIMKVPLIAERVRALDLPKIILFAVHTEVIEQLRHALVDYGPAVVQGNVTGRARDAAITRFQRDSGCRVLLGQILAAGVSVDGSVADHTLVAEADWVPGNNLQAVFRMQNVNKTRPTFCEFIGLAGSYDEKVQATWRRKTRDLHALLG